VVVLVDDAAAVLAKIGSLPWIGCPEWNPSSVIGQLDCRSSTTYGRPTAIRPGRRVPFG
jgi:hypothetical protein